MQTNLKEYIPTPVPDSPDLKPKFLLVEDCESHKPERQPSAGPSTTAGLVVVVHNLVGLSGN